MRSIGDKIAGEISLNKKFTVYDRENMAFVLEQLSPKPPSPCPDVQCYSDLGNQIGADQIVAGSVMVKGGKLRIALERIDAGKKRKIRGVNRVLSAKKEDFIATIMPELVKELMSGDAQKPQTTTSNNNGTLGNWAIGAGATAAVAAGVAAIVLSKKTNQAGSESQFLLEPPMHTP
jgi:hypothetical protein